MSLGCGESPTTSHSLQKNNMMAFSPCNHHRLGCVNNVKLHRRCAFNEQRSGIIQNQAGISGFHLRTIQPTVSGSCCLIAAFGME